MSVLASPEPDPTGRDEDVRRKGRKSEAGGGLQVEEAERRLRQAAGILINGAIRAVLANRGDNPAGA